jgi:demethylmenaquinone methyltransferase/2-methoxy-6-polyprenyl-1,4-benzoquinol methylase
MVQKPGFPDYYSARAREYDRVYGKPERQADLRSIEQWMVTKFSGRRVLEVACGTGHWTQLIAPAALCIVALDAAPETLEIARHRVPNNVCLLKDDAYTLAEVRGSFDAAFAGFWFSHVPLQRRKYFIENLGSVLEPEANVVLLDNKFVSGSSTPIHRTDANGDTFQLRQLDDGSEHEVLKNFPSERELLDLVEGFSDSARAIHWQYYWALEYRWRPNKSSARR